MRGALACVVVALASAAGAAPAAEKDVDPTEWLSARGVKDPASQLGDACCCVEITVGKPAEAALDCGEATPGGHAESADIAIKRVIRVVRAHKVVKVLDVLVGLQNLDWPPGSRHWIDLPVTIAPGGRALTIANPVDTVYSCAHASGTTDFDTWVARVCASRGTYRWIGRRFTRVTR